MELAVSQKGQEKGWTIALIPSKEQLREVHMHSLQERIAKRALQMTQQDSAWRDPERLTITQRAFGHTVKNDKSWQLKKCQKVEKSRVRKLSWIQKRRLAPIPTILSPISGRAAAQWYCGTFHAWQGSQVRDKKTCLRVPEKGSSKNGQDKPECRWEEKRSSELYCSWESCAQQCGLCFAHQYIPAEMAQIVITTLTLKFEIPAENRRNEPGI